MTQSSPVPYPLQVARGLLSAKVSPVAGVQSAPVYRWPTEAGRWMIDAANHRKGCPMPPDRVVIIGASTTGLFAAAAAAGSGRSVTVLDRDDLPSEPVARPGVPQGRQPHVFLHRGLLAAEQLLPGFREDLLAVGAVAFDTAEMAWLGEQGWANRTSRAFEVLSTSRPLLETTLRRRVVELPDVQIVGGRPGRRAGRPSGHTGR